jgi:pimeloyl-ACP methyl ester carboxylesterase
MSFMPHNVRGEARHVREDSEFMTLSEMTVGPVTTGKDRFRRGLPWLMAALALGAIVFAIWKLESSTNGLAISTQRLGKTPVTVFRPATGQGAATATGADRTPVILIAHGFAGSQQLMQPFAVTLARHGFVAVTFDFPGHGRNSVPMRGGLADQNESLRVLLASMDELGKFAQGLPGADGRYAVIGHSMASDIVVRHAQAHPEVQATVGVSLFAPSITADTRGDSPRNLLVIDGALEPSMMSIEALRVVGRVAGPAAATSTTYGDFREGTARRATLSPGAEHIGVLYNASTLSETLAWLNAAFARPSGKDNFVDARGPWLGMLLAGVVLLAWPLSRCLPHVGPGGKTFSPRVRWWRWRGQAPVTVLPALLTPLALWKVPSDFLPILLGDYLVLHFGLYGLLTILGLMLTGRPMPRIASGHAAALGVAILLTTAYALFMVGVPVDRYLFNVRPEVVRLPLILAMCAGTLPYFLADEWLAREARAAPGAYFVSKLCFLLSLVLAIALNPHRLFFLAMIVPAILLLFVVYGLFSRWVYRQTGHPAVAATANALAFGCFIGVTFPLVA